MKLQSINPTNEEVIGELLIAEKSEVNKAVSNAQKSFFNWSETDVSERSSILQNVANEIKKNKEELSKLITKEMGKIIKESEEEVNETINEIEWFAKEGKKYLETEKIELSGAKANINFEPLGVVGTITAWNFPLSTPLWKIIPALLTGNTVVWKPSEYVPFTSHKIMELFKLAGIPEGVLNLVIGDEATGKYLVDSKVDIVCLTGSSETGKKVAARAGRKLKKVVLELGGSDPFIVLEDIDVNKAVEGAVVGRFLNCGQCCTAAKRFFIHSSIVDEFTAKFVEKVKQLKIGDPLDSSTQIGPLVSSNQLTILEEQVKDAIQVGANLLYGGKRPENISKGYFYMPTVFDNVNRKMKVLRQETFGPVAPIMSFETTREAVKLANDTNYGLGASIWTKNIEEVEAIAKQIKSGIVWINDVNMPYPQCPWGGVKESGIGKELSKYGILEFVNIKPVIVK